MIRLKYCTGIMALTIVALLIYCPVFSQVVMLKLGHHNHADHLISKGLVEFAKKVEHQSEKKCTIQIYPGSQLGSPSGLFAMVKQGSLDMAVISTSFLATEIKELGLLGMPFVFRGYNEADQFIRGGTGKTYLNLFSEFGLFGLSYFEDGMIGIASARRPIKLVDDFKGLKVMINTPKVVSSSLKLLGAAPVSVPFNETYQALQHGIGDSRLLNVKYYDSGNYKEVAPFFSLTNQFYASQILFMNKKAFNKLPKDLKGILIKSAASTSKIQRNRSRNREIAILNKLKEQGVQIVFTPDIQGMQKAMIPIYREYSVFWDKFIDCDPCPFPPWCCN